MAETWRAEIATMMEDVETSYKRFQSEQVLMNETMKSEKITEIEAKEKAVKDFQREKFGPNGELFKKRQELVKPIQDKVYAAIEAYAKKRGYDFVYDRSSNASMLYANPELDKTQDLIDALKE